MNTTTGMIRPHQNRLGFLYRLIDGLIIALAFGFTAVINSIALTDEFRIFILLSIGTFWIASESVDLYRSWRVSEFSELATTTIFSWLITFFAVFLMGYLTDSLGSFTRGIVATWAVGALFLLLFWRLCFRIILQTLRRQNLNTRSAIIIGAGESGISLYDQLKEQNEMGIRLLGMYDDRCPTRLDVDHEIRGTISDAVQIARNGDVDLVFIALPMRAENRTLGLLESFADSTATVHLVPNFFVYNLLHSRWHRVGDTMTLSIHDSPAQGFGGWLKRLEDLLFGGAILLAAAVPMLTIAALIKLTSRGPVLFIQDRYGLDGRHIRVFKFRSMRTMDNGPVVKQASANDNRITPLGKILRRTSLDELPQLFNVIEGSMSLVGPRPHAVAHNEEYRTMIRGYMLRHKVKPGMTGWAQVNGWRGETESLDKMENRVRCDLEYINRWSLWLDIKIIFMTIFSSTLVSKNAY